MKAVLSFAVLAVVVAITESSVIASDVNSDSSDGSSPLVIEYTKVIDLYNDDSLDGSPSPSADIPLSRSNFHWGNIGFFDKRLHRAIVSEPGVANARLRITVHYNGNSKNVVNAARAWQDALNQGVSASITRGGLGQSFISITLTSSVGVGVYYTVDIWGR